MPWPMSNSIEYQASRNEVRASVGRVSSKRNGNVRTGIVKFLIVFCSSLSCTCLQAQVRRSISVRTPDKITIAAQEWGNPSGPEIVFIHGLSQSHLSWTKQ